MLVSVVTKHRENISLKLLVGWWSTNNHSLLYFFTISFKNLAILTDIDKSDINIILGNTGNDDLIISFIFSSTAAVYGEPKSIPINEDDEKNPINPYGQSKLAAEYLIQSWAKAFNRQCVIFRYFNVAGAHENGKIGIKGKTLTHLLPLVISSVLDLSKTFYIFGNDYETKDGTCIRDFVHVNDLVNAHVLGMEWSLKNNKSDIFNLGTSQGFSVKEVLDKSIETLKININYQIGPRRAGDPGQLFSNNEKATKILHWQPSYSLEEIIKSEYQFRKNNK